MKKIKKAFYIFSFENNDKEDFDYFIGQDHLSGYDQKKEVVNYMLTMDYAETPRQAEQKLLSIYKQDTQSLIKHLSN